jgi:hypothetical protein
MTDILYMVKIRQVGVVPKFHQNKLYSSFINDDNFECLNLTLIVQA